MCEQSKKCLSPGQSTRFLDISQNLNNHQAQKKAPRRVPVQQIQSTTESDAWQKAKDVARGILAVLLLSLSMIVDINL